MDIPQDPNPQDASFQGPEAAYLAALRDGRFCYQRTETGRAVFPPRLVAPGDGAALVWAQSAGRGAVHAVTEQPQKPPSAARVFAIVDMDEGFRLFARIDTIDPVQIGQRLIARIAAEADPPHVYFVPEAPQDV